MARSRLGVPAENRCPFRSPMIVDLSIRIRKLS
jgi:hypothetical protein